MQYFRGSHIDHNESVNNKAKHACVPVLHARHEVSGWPNKWAWEQILDIWPILLKFALTNDPLLFVTGRGWCKSSAKMTKRVTIEKSKLFSVIPKTISIIPYPYNYLVSYSLSLKLFCQLSLIPKTPNRASLILRSTFCPSRTCNHIPQEISTRYSKYQ